MHLTIIVHVFRVEATCDKSVISDTRSTQSTKSVRCICEGRKNVENVQWP